MKKKLQIHKLLLTAMRISILQVFLAVWFVGTTFASDSRAQSILNQKITLSAQEQEVRSLLSQIEKQASVKFVFSSKLIQSNRKLKVDMQNESLSKVLDNLLRSLRLTYEVSGNIIILNRMDGTEARTTISDANQSLANPNAEMVEQTVSGKVTDESGDALPGVNVLIKGSQRGVTTDGKGQYKITVDDNDVLVFSFVGYTKQEIPVNKKAVINVTLAVDTKALEEVVVIGYGTVKKSDLTGSVASIGSKEIKSMPVTSVDQALQARATGINVVQASGAPGGSSTVRIRGSNSINSGSEPLYVIDGFPVYPSNSTFSAGGDRQPSNIMATINPGDIESVEILKDASATSIYGSRGANGVVLITTRRGKSGATKIDYEGSQSFQNIAKKVDVLNATDYARYQNLRAQSRNQSIPYPNPEQFGQGINWLDEISRQGAIMSHQLTFSGGSDKTQYALMTGYFKNNGIIKNTDFERINVRLNLDSKFLNDKLRSGSSLFFSRTTTNAIPTDRGGPGGAIITALGQSPLKGIYNADGTYALDSYDGRFVVNPLAEVVEIIDNDKTNRFLGTTYLQYELMKGLSIKSSFGVDLINTNRFTFYSRQTRLGRQNDVDRTDANRTVANFLNENTVSYNTKIGTDHSFDAIAGYTYQTDDNRYFGINSRGFLIDDPNVANLQNGLTPQIPSSSRGQWTLQSFLARANYNYLGRYLLTLTFRRDGSSKFGINNKWANFPSVALGWRLKDEPFMKDVTAISEAKVRGSFGITGNSEIPVYRSLAGFDVTNYIINGALVSGLSENRVSNPDLKWETTKQFNVGLDLGLLNNRLNITTDYFFNTTQDLLLNVALPTSTGFRSSFQNSGSLQNSGFEFAANWVAIDNKDLKLSLNGNISFLDNKITSIGSSAPFYADSPSGHLGVFGSRVEVGYPIGTWFGYKYAGLWQNEAEINSSPSRPGDKPGYPKYVDINGDGKIDLGDVTFLGTPNPDFIWGFNASLTYKKVDVSLFFRGSQGNKVRNLQQAEMADGVGNYNQVANILTDSWSPSNTSATRPVIDATREFANYFRRSDFFIEDGSFVRLQNVSVGYRLPTTKFLRSARVYVSGQNVLLFTKYKGFDPEVNNGGQSNLNRGDDYDAYPRPRTITMGVQLGF
jgi:TonB-linked SusC/RagA family outer membrane protein